MQLKPCSECRSFSVCSVGPLKLMTDLINISRKISQGYRSRPQHPTIDSRLQARNTATHTNNVQLCLDTPKNNDITSISRLHNLPHHISKHIADINNSHIHIIQSSQTSHASRKVNPAYPSRAIPKRIARSPGPTRPRTSHKNDAPLSNKPATNIRRIRYSNGRNDHRTR